MHETIFFELWLQRCNNFTNGVIIRILIGFPENYSKCCYKFLPSEYWWYLSFEIKNTGF